MPGTAAAFKTSDERAGAAKGQRAAEIQKQRRGGVWQRAQVCAQRGWRRDGKALGEWRHGQRAKRETVLGMTDGGEGGCRCRRREPRREAVIYQTSACLCR